MCVILVKNGGVEMPDKKTIKKCWDRNPDGAGYMFPKGNDVVIKKGYMKFKDFYSDVMKDYKSQTKFTPFVLHFRISTQGGVTPQLTHPFPISENMDDLRKLKTKSKVAMVHNGVINMTSVGYKTAVTYSDTMTFITDYLSYIIRDNVKYHDDEKTLTLINNLADGNKFAIMGNDGQIVLIGDFTKHTDDCSYSNMYWNSNYTYSYGKYNGIYRDYDTYYSTEIGDYAYNKDGELVFLNNDKVSADSCCDFNDDYSDLPSEYYITSKNDYNHLSNGTESYWRDYTMAEEYGDIVKFRGELYYNLDGDLFKMIDDDAKYYEDSLTEFMNEIEEISMSYKKGLAGQEKMNIITD